MIRISGQKILNNWLFSQNTSKIHYNISNAWVPGLYTNIEIEKLSHLSIIFLDLGPGVEIWRFFQDGGGEEPPFIRVNSLYFTCKSRIHVLTLGTLITALNYGTRLNMLVKVPFYSSFIIKILTTMFDSSMNRLNMLVKVPFFNCFIFTILTTMFYSSMNRLNMLVKVPFFNCFIVTILTTMFDSSMNRLNMLVKVPFLVAL